MNQAERKAYNKAYRLAHKAEIKAYEKTRKPRNRRTYQKAYRDSHKAEYAEYHLSRKEEIAEYNKAYCLAHKKEIAGRHKLYRLAHKKEINTLSKAYRLANKKKIAELKKAYQRKYPEKQRNISRKYRALKRGSNHETYTEAYIFERDGWICQFCGRKINKRLKWPNPLSKSIDHIIPLSKGGDDSPINVQAAHLRCNIMKQAQSGGQLRLIG